MDLTNIRSKLIMYKTYSKLRKDLVEEIQDKLINTNKESDFEQLLKKVEEELNITNIYHK